MSSWSSLSTTHLLWLLEGQLLFENLHFLLSSAEPRPGSQRWKLERCLRVVGALNQSRRISKTTWLLSSAFLL